MNSVSDIDPRILPICDGYQRAVYEKDVDAFVGLYHQKARVFDTWDAWSYEGIGERRKVIEQWFSSLGDERVGVAFDRIQTVVVHELATVTARVVYAGLSAAGNELRSMQNRLTWVLKSEGGAWKIIHEHTSVPIGNDLKGKLQRE
jgi:ketosteroid isomerase-like protein